MGLTITLGGNRVTSAHVTLPKWGAWYADALVDGEHALSGGAAMQLAGLALSGTVLSGGPMKGRSSFRLIGGKGGWGKTLPKKSYADDAGVKASRVLSDAAAECGETIDASTLPSTRLGPSWTRPEGLASAVLELIAPAGWYVGEDGVTRIGSRAAKALTSAIPRVSPVDLARQTVTLAPESAATLVPGITVDGIEAVDVVHEVTPKGLRTTIYGSLNAGLAGPFASLRRLLEQLDPGRKYRSTWEYRVVTQDGERLNLQPVRVSSGMPDLQRVTVHPGISGAKSDVKLGSRVLVTFIDESPSRPVVVGFEDAEGEGFTPLLTSIDASTFVSLADGARLVPATGDLAGGIWPIVGTTRVKA